MTATALSLRAIQLYGKEPEPKVVAARKWLETVKPQSTEDRVMQLLGLTWAKTDSEQLANAARALLSEQRPDGGWAQLPALETDAYATGQALVALNLSRQVAVSDPAYQRGIASDPARRRLLAGAYTQLPLPALQRKRLPSRQGSVDLHCRIELGRDGV